MKPLSPLTLAELPPHVGRPGYDRSSLRTGILHFGPGAFHRAHQADYVDRLLETDPRWGIAAVSMRSKATVQGLAEQDGLYTLAVLDTEPGFRILGAHRRFLGPEDGAEVQGLLAHPDVRIVSSTVTEKGYCLAGDGRLDFSHPDIVHDLEGGSQPASLVGWLAAGLRARRDAGIAPFTPLCCDNMVSNGRKLGAAVRDFTAASDPELARWIEAEVRFPNSMVDSITPATDDAVRARVREAIGLDDAIPVSREAYTAWVIEDVLPDGAPDFGSVGVALTSDVAAHELAKLRILNGAHSSLAYIGLLIGHATVADAMNDPELARFVRRLVSESIIPSLPPSSAIDLDRYAAEIMERFLNPAIGHKLSQIAWDGSQKLPYRLLDTVAETRRSGRPLDQLAIPVAAWMLFVGRQAKAAVPIVDPLAERLTAIGKGSEGPDHLVEALLGLPNMFPPELAGDEPFRSSVLAAARTLHEGGAGAAIAAANRRTG